MGLIKTACLATLGLESRARELVKDLVRQGEESQSDVARSVRKALDKLDRVEGDLWQEEGKVLERLCQKLQVPTRGDVESLHRKIDELASSVAALRARPRA